MRVRIDVTQEDIACGCRGNGLACPVGRAAQRALADNTVFAGPALLWVGDVKISMPGEARKAIAVFDDTGRMDPFTFEVEVPSEAQHG